MPPPSSHPSLFLRLLKQPFFVTQLQPNAAIPVPFLEALSSDTSGRFLSITRTAEEISIVGEVASILPVDVDDSKWKCINIAGPMEFGLTGVLSSFTAPLKDAKIPIFAVSTWNTDYILVPMDKTDEAVSVLKNDGWTFAEA
ncbi:hypothetical protein PILCRDRAFT_820774 [Piloderma croceum F 1598]|uniref:CASTOR ACT domain-containing protein n=1 Tax=Piloderma croceum (strain F 1598) TaxID=765440 RepID=A0A0C3BYB3_PILCF|nr:hypothetical protein PILCRDRAFT_820774 [Piloderma croceum F 1598]